MEKFYTVKEIAENLKMHHVSIRRWIADGKLIAVRLGRELRVSESDLKRFMDKRRVV